MGRARVRSPGAASPPVEAPGFSEEWSSPVGRDPSLRALSPPRGPRTQAVVYRGAPAPRLLFIGEAPGAEEDRLGLPFVGRSGAMLDAAVAELGLGPEEFGVLNVLKCRPPGNRFDAGPRPTVAARTSTDRWRCSGPRSSLRWGRGRSRPSTEARFP